MSSGDWARGPVTAVVARELRTWSRDLLRFHYLVFALCYALVFCLLPLAVGASIFLPWTGLVFALWVAAISANQYAEDGTELWGKLMIPGSACHDVRGRQLAWLLVTAPTTLVLTIAMVVFTGEYGLWPWLATMLPALLVGGAGVTVLVSVLRPVPMTEPRLRGGNLLENGTDFAQVLMVESSAPELLLYLRTGVSPQRKRPAPAWKPQKSSLPKPEPHLEKLGLHLAPNGQRVYVVASLVLCWVPLAAQGIVPALMLACLERAQSIRRRVEMPSTKCRWARKKTMIIGSVVSTLPASTISHRCSPAWPNWSERALRPRGSVYNAGSRR
ncbi:ABC-2 type transport system permease protein [Amycolatopsis regifaucium]|nr:ABC-2 type transport system permease protein [Amycolatopsis regifaucium]